GRSHRGAPVAGGARPAATPWRAAPERVSADAGRVERAGAPVRDRCRDDHRQAALPPRPLGDPRAAARDRLVDEADALARRRPVRGAAVPGRAGGAARDARPAAARLAPLERGRVRHRARGGDLLRLPLHRAVRRPPHAVLVHVPDDRRDLLQRALSAARLRDHRLDPRAVRPLPARYLTRAARSRHPTPRRILAHHGRVARAAAVEPPAVRRAARARPAGRPAPQFPPPPPAPPRPSAPRPPGPPPAPDARFQRPPQGLRGATARDTA